MLERPHQHAPGHPLNQPVERYFGIAREQALLLIGTVLAAKLVFLFVLALNSRFVMDEFVQFGWAKYLPADLFKTVWPGKAVGYAVLYKPAHLLGWDARSILLGGRLETALLACATLAVIYATARTIGRTKLQALIILVVLMSFSNFIERIFRTIAEPPAVFWAAAALLVAVRGYRSAPRIVVAGILCGLSFLTTQKAVYFDVALGLGLVGDALINRQYREVVTRGLWLVAGWLIALAIYCFAFGGLNPLPILNHLLIGPTAVLDPSVPAAYGGLRNYVVQTLARNAILYLFCFAGIAIALTRIRALNPPARIALIFTVVITGFIFTHDQPWPYVFVMCLPFMALWALEPFTVAEAKPVIVPVLTAVLAVGVAGSFLRNVAYLQLHNRDQLALIGRAEGLLAPGDTYFDGVAMLPNRREPSALWLDRISILRTLHEKEASEAYGIFARTPPKLILWNYRLDGISGLIKPLIQNSYVKIAPNTRIAGRILQRGRTVAFDVPFAGVYRLYDGKGRPLNGRIKVNGVGFITPLHLERGPKTIALEAGASEAILLPEGNYDGKFSGDGDYPDLFAGVYS